MGKSTNLDLDQSFHGGQIAFEHVQVLIEVLLDVFVLCNELPQVLFDTSHGRLQFIPGDVNRFDVGLQGLVQL